MGVFWLGTYLNAVRNTLIAAIKKIRQAHQVTSMNACLGQIWPIS